MKDNTKKINALKALKEKKNGASLACVLKKYNLAKSTYYLYTRKKAKEKETLASFLARIVGSAFIQYSIKEESRALQKATRTIIYQRAKYIDKSSLLLFVGGCSIPTIEMVLRARKKRFKTISALFSGSCSFLDFIQCTKEAYTEFIPDVSKVCFEDIALFMHHFIMDKQPDLLSDFDFITLIKSIQKM